MQATRKRGSKRQRLMDILEDCDGWAKGKTWQELTKAIYGTSDPANRSNLRSHISRVKRIYTKDRRALMSIKGPNGEYRYCFVQTPQEASAGLTMVLLQLDGNVHGYKRAQSLLWGKIPRQIKGTINTLQMQLSTLAALPPRAVAAQLELEEAKKEEEAR